jgi:calmodulin-binding transcription activator
VDSQFQQNLEYQPPGSLDSSDLQLSAAKRFLLGPEDSIDSPSSNFVLGNMENSGTGMLSGHDGGLESSLNPDWKTKAQSAFQSKSQGSEITELFGHGQFEPGPRADTRLNLGQNRLFNIREISPEWAFSYEITKVNHDVLRFLDLKTSSHFVSLPLSLHLIDAGHHYWRFLVGSIEFMLGSDVW